MPVPMQAAALANLSAILGDIGTVVTSAITWAGQMIDQITGNEALFLFVIAIPVVGYGVHLIKMLLHA